MRFILLDRITLLEVGRRAEGFKVIAPGEDYFRDHFPGYPLVPGVLVIESIAQLGGRLVEASVREASGRRVLPMLAKLDQVKLLQQVRPSDRLDLSVAVLALGVDVARVTGEARVHGRKVARAEIMYALLDITDAATMLTSEQVHALTEWSDRQWRSLQGED
jgi:3-hydroxyacyl-[acyl-carrier-protein] dehydratase